jgi:tRNA threonylcarbamoyladenosine biosynthesis protein TsaB
VLLAIETVGRSGTVNAVGADGAELAWTDLAGTPTEAGLVPAIAAIIAAHGAPTRIAIAAGPGSFTGLRTGIATARTLAWIDRIPVHPVDSLAACAMAAGDGRWWVSLPLKKDTTFHAIYGVAGGHLTIAHPAVAVPDADALPWPVDGAVAIGPGLTAKPELIARYAPQGIRGSAAPPTARGVARLAAQTPAVAWDALVPVYGQEPAPVLQRAAAERAAKA